MIRGAPSTVKGENDAAALLAITALLILSAATVWLHQMRKRRERATE